MVATQNFSNNSNWNGSAVVQKTHCRVAWSQLSWETSNFTLSKDKERERYCIILIWKIIENKSQNLSDPILCNFSDRRGRSCAISHVDPGSLGTLAYNSFRWRAIRLFNSLPKTIRDCHTFYNVVFILDNCIIIQVLYILQRTTLRPNKK